MENLVWIIYLIDVVCGSWEGTGFILGMVMLLAFIGLGVRTVCILDDDVKPEDIEKLKKVTP